MSRALLLQVCREDLGESISQGKSVAEPVAEPVAKASKMCLSPALFVWNNHP